VLTLDEGLQDTIFACLALLEALPADSPFQTLDPPQRRQRTLDALKRVLRRESQVQPLLLVFEDLHWLDAETQALLDSLVESLPATRLLLLVNYRPEYQHSWGSKTYYTQLRLDPLPATNADELLQALLGEDPSLEPLKRLLIARTEGNPFFLEESVRTLVETSVLVGAPGAYHLAPPVGAAPRGRPEVGNHRGLPLPIDMQMPATVQAVLAARIDRLPSEDKRLLQTAAVIGHELSLPLLQAIAELPETDLHRGLAHLQATEFLYETRLFPDVAYTFKHALTHEVAYGSLLQARRRTLHARIVEALETRSADRLAEQVEQLAHHALRGEVWEQAVAYCRQAGTKAYARVANQEAAAAFEQALELRLDLRQALHPLAEDERILAHLRQAERLAEALPLLERVLKQDVAMRHTRYAVWLGEGYMLAGHLEEALRLGQRALALAEELGTRPLLAHCHCGLGTLYAKSRQREQARAKLSTAIALFRSMDMTFWLPQAEAALAQVEER
jgi:predicted ATPase